MRTSTIKEKAKAIWRKYKWPILLVVTASGIMLACSRNEQKNGPSDEKLEEAVKRELLEPDEEAGKEADIPKEEPTEPEDDYSSEFNRKMNDPDNQIPGGGWVLEDCLHNSDLPEIIANDVPVSSLGMFGEEMIRRADGADLWKFNQDLTKARCSVIANFQMPEEEDTNDQLQDSAQ